MYGKRIMKELITHVSNDPNAKYHARIGLAASLWGAAVGWYVLGVYGAMAGFAISPLLAGIGIETVQRIQRGYWQGRESVLDAMGTWLWPLYYMTRFNMIR